MRLSIILTSVFVAAFVFVSTASAATFTLHPGQSKKVGQVTIICTQSKLAKTSRRIVLHPGSQVTVNGVRVRCMRRTVPVPSHAVGTRSNPFPLGTRVAGSQWAITVNSTNFDAWPLVEATNAFNHPPASGVQDVMSNLTISYLGAGSSDLSPIVTELSIVGQSGVGYTSFGNRCGVLPSPEEIDFSSLFSGATIQLNLCWQVPSSDVASVELAASNQTWLALR